MKIFLATKATQQAEDLEEDEHRLAFAIEIDMKAKSFLHNIFKSFTSPGSPDSSSTEPDLDRIASREQKHFSYESLSKATDKFHANRKLGEGGFGPVYKGKLEDGREIAVKRLSQTSRQGKKEFQNEARLLARVQHRNVVNLLGYCARGEDKLLVYEYIPNESLDKLLFKPDRREDLDWKKRYDIIIGVAKGLQYLHEDAHSCIIHRDIKASNILLDEKWVPKIADFGMARLFPENETHVNTRVAGTNGYMAPEYVMNGRLTVKADVFSFGVLMLELVTGRRNSSFNVSRDADNLLDWAYKMFKKGKSLEIMDQALAPTAVEEQVNLCIHIGLLCTQSDTNLRPTMQRVLVMLSKKSSSLDDPARPASFTGRRHHRSRRPGPSSSNAGTSGTSSTSRSEPTTSTNTNTVNTNTVTVSAHATSTSNHRSPSPRLADPHGKRPMEIEEQQH